MSSASIRTIALLVGAGVLVVLALVLFLASTHTDYVRDSLSAVTSEEPEEPQVPAATHVAMPENVRAVYMSQCAASSNSFRESLGALVDETEVNALIIDIKDFSGTVSFPRGEDVEDLGGSGCVVPDMKEYIEELHEKGVYVIGRITVFQDPLYTSAHPEQAVQSISTGGPWEDFKGLSFVDVGAKPFWDYIVDLSHESHALGFDELNFDYIRYPSDGPMRDARYDHSDYSNRETELERFFQHLSSEVRKPDSAGNVPILSADLFGMTTTNFDDLTIGQVMERATPHFDVIAPMTYPSHYPPGFNGYADPNKNVYGVIKYSLDKAIDRVESATTSIPAFSYKPIKRCTQATATTTSVCSNTGLFNKPVRSRALLRPWLQDFDYGGEYGPTEVRAQIQAAYDSGIYSWMLWAPSNRYTKAALEAAE